MNLFPLLVPEGSDGHVQFNDGGLFGADLNFFWDNVNKRLGIGTTSPHNLLEIVGGSAGSETDILQLRSQYIDTNTATTLKFVNSTSSSTNAGASEITSFRTNSPSQSADLLFRTTLSGTLIERMRIQSDGNVGIGTTGPDTLLHLESTAPILTTENETHEDTASGGEVKWLGRRQDSDGNDYDSGQIEMSHDLTSKDQLSKMILSVNTGAGLVQALKIGSDLLATFAGNLLSQNLGIGATPTTNLYVQGDGAVFNSITGHLQILDTRNFAEGVGAGIALGGEYNSAQAVATWAGITAGKENATDGNFAGTLRLWTRPNGSALVERVRIRSTGEVGFQTSTPTLPVSVLEKSGMTPIGGFAIKLTNKTGVNSVEGQLVEADDTDENSYKTADADSLDVIGVVYNAGVADASEVWIVQGGIAEVLVDAGGCVHHDRLISSNTAGSADVSNAPAVAAHFQEIGHAIETVVGAGLAKAVIHLL